MEPHLAGRISTRRAGRIGVRGEQAQAVERDDQRRRARHEAGDVERSERQVRDPPVSFDGDEDLGEYGCEQE